LPDGRRLRGISGEQAVRAFERAGYRRVSTRSSHAKLVKAGVLPLSIPLHSELKIGLLISQIRKAGLTVDEFLELLR
jgi:predicted RNA binding protein YcfA (HicA-like mRNA interferase family)